MERTRLRIVATVGPASLDRASELARAGADALRVNASHVRPGALAPALARLREQTGLPIIVDLQGAKMRLGWFPEREVHPADRVRFALQPAAAEIPAPHPELFAASRPGDTLSCDDGRLRFIVESASPERMEARCAAGGVLRSRKGVNLVEHPVELEDLPLGDRAFLEEAKGIAGISWAISFMRDGGEAGWLRRRAPGAEVIGKVERAEAVANLESIARAVDAVWICRGDLGVQIGLAEMARFVGQLRPTGLASPVWMAGQVMEHLTGHAEPTRSEVCHLFDLAARGYAGVVLSDETAIGTDPIGAVRTVAGLLGELA